MTSTPSDPAPATGARAAFSDHPEAYIARDVRQALADGRAMPDRVRGSALFADISGFTQLTEALRDEFGPQRGAEALTAHLDRVFHALIAELDRFGGNVVYFSGDAITAWIDGDDGRRALASALAMQQVMAETGRIVTGGGASVQLALKVAVATGTARRFMVGDPDIQRIDVLAGALLDDLAGAEHAAQQGEVLADASVLDALGDAVRVAELRSAEDTGRRVGVVAGLTIDVEDAPAPEPPPLDPAIVRQWLLPVVYERISTGRGEFLAELRAAYPVFLRFGGIDFDDDDDAIDKLDAFVVAAQRIFDRYGGNVLQLTLGDKGAYVYGIFGAPVAHEDDARRAATAARELLALEHDTSARDIQIGIAHGPLRSGTYGHAMRRTFVCLGDAVNLAARLMSKAPAGNIYVSDEVFSAAGDDFVWEPLEPLQLKGKARPVQAHALTGSLLALARRRIRYELPIFGREQELRRLQSGLGEARNGRGRILAISAEAGLGKSRLLAEFVRDARRQGVFVAFGECQSFGINSSYLVWREIWQRLLGVDEEAPPEQQRTEAEDALGRIDPELLPRLPLLAEVLGVSIADTELTRSFDAKLRKSSLEDLLTICLRARAGDEPLVLVLEDCHWIDDLSRDLLEVLARASADLGVLMVLAYRPAVAPGGELDIERLPHFQEFQLGELGSAELRELIAAKAAAVFDEGALSASLVELIETRSEGNPFYAEELLNYIAGQGVASAADAAKLDLQLPDSMQALVLSRIDALAEAPRRTLKVASVVGRLFDAPTLASVYPELGDLDGLRPQLADLCAEDLITLDQEETLSYLFRHVVTQEVSYASMPFAIRAGLHRRVGEFIEQIRADDLEPHLDLLAHHFWHSDADDKKREYLARAEASARSRYANDAAIEYGERLADLVEGAERAEALLNLGKVLELTGRWVRAEEVIAEAAALAVEQADELLGARCEAAAAEVARKQGRFDEAGERLRRAAQAFRAHGDDAGLGLVLHVSGTLAAQQGDYDAARTAYQDSLAIREALDDRAAVASLYSNLAIVAEYGKDLPAARSACEHALAIRTEIGDRWGIGVSQNNLGLIAILQEDHAEARDRLEASIRLCREVGDSWMVTLAQNNLGNAYRELGDAGAAAANYGASLLGYRNNGDEWGLTFLLEDVAVFALLEQEPTMALELLGAADGRHDAIGSPRSPAHQDELDARFAEAKQALGKKAVDKALRRGRKRSAEAAIELGLEFSRRWRW